MAKFFGKIGFGHNVKTAPGVWEDAIVEYEYYGDIVRNARRLEEGDYLHHDLRVTNQISIVADAYAREHFHAMRYIEWAGNRWTITEVEVQPPRLLLRLGGDYNGPTG